MTSSTPDLESVPTDPERQPGGSLLTVLVALAANALIAVAKSIVATITGSASMVAEAAHSWADTGNEIFLLIAERRSAKPPDKLRPLGYGREAYVWSMFAAIGLFAAGALVSVWHGITQLGSDAEETSYGWAYAVLGIAFLLEGTSFIQALRQTRTDSARFGMRPVKFIATTSNPTLRAVFVEDFAALVGLLLAAGGIGLHQLTGDAVWDAIGSILVGLLLGVIAIFLIARNRDFLTGQVANPAIHAAAEKALMSEPAIESVSFLHMEYIGPMRVLLVAAVDIAGDLPEPQLATELQAIEDRLNDQEFIQRAILTLSAPGRPGL